MLVAHALLRAVSRLISTRLADSGRSHDCERGMHECMRHMIPLAGAIKSQTNPRLQTAPLHALPR